MHSIAENSLVFYRYTGSITKVQDLIKGSDAKPSVELNLMLREGEKKRV